jgi:hypothetical protein
MKAAVLAALLALGACNPSLIAYSGPPPARTAQLDPVKNFWGVTKSYRMQLSSGVALAVVCYHGGPCENLTIRSADGTIAEVRQASLGQLAHGYDRSTPLSGFVVVGKAAGTTKLHLKTKDGWREIAVTVEAAPARGASATVAN